MREAKADCSARIRDQSANQNIENEGLDNVFGKNHHTDCHLLKLHMHSNTVLRDAARETVTIKKTLKDKAKSKGTFRENLNLQPRSQ